MIAYAAHEIRQRFTFTYMIKLFLPAFIFLVLSLHSIAQPAAPPARYKDFVFDAVKVQKNGCYKTTIPAGIHKKYYRFDFYEPAADSTGLRPLIIWLHGGGFKFGKKTSAGTPVWSKTFAQRGYVCAAINYRLSSKHPLKNFADLLEGCMDAVEDLDSAIQFFKQHYIEYRIDTNLIIAGGNSAGGMIALQAVYSSPRQMALLAKQPDTLSREYHPPKLAAIINCWGAIFDIRWLNNNRVPIVSVHGKNDRVVPYDNKNPSLFGSLAIHRTADSIGIPNTIKIFSGYAHELQKHFNPLFAGRKARKRWLEAGEFIAAFLYRQLFAVQ
jgi:predicted esterase